MHAPNRWVRCDVSFVFTARRYGSAVFAVVVCPFVCLSVTSRYYIETTGRIELGSGMEVSFHYPTLCYKRTWVSSEIRVLPSGTSSQTRDIENFAAASRLRCQQNSSSSSSSTVELVDDTLFDSRRIVAVYYKSVSCNPVTPLPRFVVDLLETNGRKDGHDRLHCICCLRGQ